MDTRANPRSGLERDGGSGPRAASRRARGADGSDSETGCHGKRTRSSLWKYRYALPDLRLAGGGEGLLLECREPRSSRIQVAILSGLSVSNHGRIAKGVGLFPKRDGDTT